jgi:hypothetical protein
MSIRRSQSNSTPEAEALAAALAELGVPCRVETRGHLAVVLADAGGAKRFGEADVRQRALAVAREHGFTHLALELE